MQNKIRHWGVTAWLVLIIVVNVITIIAHTLYSDVMIVSEYESTKLHQQVLVAVSALNVICSFAMLFWKKWGFKGIVISVGLIFCTSINLDLHPSPIILVLSGPVILFVLLQRRIEGVTTWDQLE